MRVASAAVMLLYCGIVFSAGCGIDENRCSDDGGLLPLLLSQMSQRVTEMGAEFRVLDAQSTTDARELSQMRAEIRALQAQTAADAQTLQTITRQLQEQAPTSPAASISTGGNTADAATLAQMGADIRDLQAQSTADAQTLSQNAAKIQVLEDQSTADAQTLSQNAAKIQVLEDQSTADAQTLSQNAAKIQVLEDQSTADAQTLSQMGAEIQALRNQTTADAQTLSQLGAEIPVLQAQSSADAETLSQVEAGIQVLQAQSTADAETLQNMTRQLGEMPTSVGSTFVRWGALSCATGSSLVYKGRVGGGWYDHPGAAANRLCLTAEPRLSNRAIPAFTAEVYGAEYQTFDSHNNWDIVCAVCRTELSTTIMIPGTDTCTPGWQRQYSGFIMAGRIDVAASSEYICVAGVLETAESSSGESSSANKNGATLFFTQTRCGSLPCGPYVDHKIVTCVVCSK